MKFLNVLRGPLVLAVAALITACSTAPGVPKNSGSSALESVPPMVATPKPPPKIGLALGGGAARGFAHVGVIQVLVSNAVSI
ncbi:hypothetical protein RAE21_04740 [Rhodoferax sp. TBRC 17198]|uniref:hypothetical protein n=1 Tax=Rhodoferax potami TaxID=3068338 RepID=UPI0028BD626C|nr:hypothetical protein [Rhodoferax sp. TBRC 17198]MDT7521719.1 hypothetical protein [Rhodoferax sp. TBRC 17198]